MKNPIELSGKKSAYGVYVYGAPDVRLFPNKRFNVDLKNIEIWVSHGLKRIAQQITTYWFSLYFPVHFAQSRAYMHIIKSIVS